MVNSESRREEEPIRVWSLSDYDFLGLLGKVHDKGAKFRFRAEGYSMSPFINNGDIIILSPYLAASSSIGDVVAFIHPETGKLRIHRIVGWKRGFYLIKGDGAPSSDGLIPEENVMGTVTGLERRGKHLNLGLGPEKHIIAFLNRLGIFFILRPFFMLIHRSLRRLFP